MRIAIQAIVISIFAMGCASSPGGCCADGTGYCATSTACNACGGDAGAARGYWDVHGS